jgi:hypothetical protein
MSDVINVALTRAEIDLIKDVLRHAKRAKEDYDRYPDAEFRRKQVAEISAVLEKLP